MNKKTAAIYARVSTAMQDVENSIQAQVRACQEYARKQNYSIHDIYIDKAESGRTSDRPEFQRMLQDGKKKRFEVILIHKIDRFSRSREDAVTYKALLRRHGVELFSVTEQLGDDIYSRLIEGILEVVAEFYSLNLAQEVRKGQKETMRRGYYRGGEFPFGYTGKKVDVKGRIKTKLVPHPQEGPIIQKLFEIAASGGNSIDMLKYLRSSSVKPKHKDTWVKSSIFFILKNEVYIGKAKYNSEVIENAHEPLVDEETFRNAQREKKRNHGRRNKHELHYPLVGPFSRCANCGNKIASSKKSDNTRYYMCISYRYDSTCPPKKVNAEITENIVKKILLEKLKNYNLEKIFKNSDKKDKNTKTALAKEIKKIKKKIKEIDTQKENIIEAIAEGFKSEHFKNKIEELIKEREFFEKELSKIPQGSPNKPQTSVNSLAKILEKAPFEKLKSIYTDQIELELDMINKKGVLYIKHIPGLEEPIKFDIPRKKYTRKKKRA